MNSCPTLPRIYGIMQTAVERSSVVIKKAVCQYLLLESLVHKCLCSYANGAIECTICIITLKI